MRSGRMSAPVAVGETCLIGFDEKLGTDTDRHSHLNKDCIRIICVHAEISTIALASCKKRWSAENFCTQKERRWGIGAAVPRAFVAIVAWCTLLLAVSLCAVLTSAVCSS